MGLPKRKDVVSKLQGIFSQPIVIRIGEPEPGSIGIGPQGMFAIPDPDNPAKTVELAMGTDEKYRVGQVWRTGGTESQLTILKIDTVIIGGEASDLIFHVRVDGLKIMVEGLPGPTSIQHLPLSRNALEQSDLELIQENAEIPEFHEGYNIWREAFLNNSGGAFDTSV